MSSAPFLFLHPTGTRLLAVLLVAGAGTFGVGLAKAQEAKGGLDARAAEAMLARQGFRDIAPPRRKGALWVARASAPDGRRIVAVVDAASGEIAGLTPVDGPPIPARGLASGF